MSVPAIESDSDLRLEERALVERMLAGDESAMEEFADGYFPGLYRFACARLDGDRELARDIAQTTACKVLAKLQSYRGEAPLATWLCACCRNEIRMHFRQRQRLPRVVGLDIDLNRELNRGLDGELPFGEPGWGLAAHREPGEHPEGALARKEEARLVHATLDLLPPRYAQALEWKYLDRLAVQEIAARLRLSAKAAESLLTRARQAFRASYERLTRRGGGGVVQAAREMEP